MLPASKDTNKSQTTTLLEILELLPFSGKKKTWNFDTGAWDCDDHQASHTFLREQDKTAQPFPISQQKKKIKIKYNGGIHSPSKNHKVQWGLCISQYQVWLFTGSLYIPKGKHDGILKPLI